MPTSFSPPLKDDKVECGNCGTKPKQVTVTLLPCASLRECFAKVTVTLGRAEIGLCGELDRLQEITTSK